MKSFAITVDVEPDAIYPTWKTSNPLSFKGVHEGFAKLERITKSHDVKFTYFVQPVVLYDSHCMETIYASSGELGSHLHGDYIDPKSRYFGNFGGCDPIEKQRDYSFSVEYYKLENLTKLFEVKPVSFRAGRFGSGKNTKKILAQLGYTHDSSEVPNTKHSPGAKSIRPYKQDGIIEIPITVIHKKWLRPTNGFSDKHEIKEIVNLLVRKNINCACCMFHNVELVPGCSPYAESMAECNRIIDRLLFVIDTLRKNSFVSRHVKEINV